MTGSQCSEDTDTHREAAVAAGGRAGGGQCGQRLCVAEGEPPSQCSWSTERGQSRCGCRTASSEGVPRGGRQCRRGSEGGKEPPRQALPQVCPQPTWTRGLVSGHRTQLHTTLHPEMQASWG